jgi:large subunit ribosomal protein L2
MGKTLIQQARGHGSPTYRVRRKAFSIHPRYPVKFNENEEFEVVKLVRSLAHSAPLAKLQSLTNRRNIFFNFATNGMYVGQKIKVNGTEPGDVARLGSLNTSTPIFNLEIRPGDGGKMVRSGGNSAMLFEKKENSVMVLLPSKATKELHADCRATIGVISGHGRLEKPILKAGRQFYIKRGKQKLWPRTSAVKMNAVDHPFGSGRGKRIKSKIAKRNAPAGAKVGLIRPARTGRRKH